MIKKFISRESFFYKIYLYYRLIYKEKYYIKRKTYAQRGEDLFIFNYMKKKKIVNGTYVDIGAFHPIKYSNTCLLFNNGWSGLNIDLNQTAIDYFDIVRPQDNNICCAISNKEEKIKVFINSIFSPINTINKSHAKKFNFASKNELSYTVKAKKFNSICKKKFDFLDIDIEGSDFMVLKSINLKYFKPKLICIEILDINYLIKIKKYLIKLNYFFIKRKTSSFFFEHRKIFK
tara:strand:- start:80 stop:775 length:696 start_codon:yes stop_codon:yes gene_type:complete